MTIGVSARIDSAETIAALASDIPYPGMPNNLVLVHVTVGALAEGDTDIRTKLEFCRLRRWRRTAGCRIHHRLVQQYGLPRKELDIQTILLVEGAIIDEGLHRVGTDGYRGSPRPQHLRT